jgi:hypothetical protein
MSLMPAYLPLDKQGKAVKVGKRKKKATRSRFAAGNTARKSVKERVTKEGKSRFIHTYAVGDDASLLTDNVEGEVEIVIARDGIFIDVYAIILRWSGSYPFGTF